MQSVTGCTFGKRNFIHFDHNQTVATFLRRSDGKAILVTTKPDGWGKADPEHQALFAKVRAGTITPEERTRFKVLHEKRAQALLAMPLDEIFDVAPTTVELPAKYRR
ncbi:MAG: FmdE family protein [Chloroflexi bacterium]|nr:FmdE family protein [Chloroflexota bacterium]